MIKNTKFLFYATFIVVFISCKKKCQDPTNPDCQNYDPCYGIQEIKADFEIGQIFSARLSPLADPYQAFVQDSIFPRVCSIKFKANLEGAKYKWILGAEVIEKKEFSRVFIEPAGEISVTLMVEKEPNSSCHPQDDGRDTLTKTFKLVEYCDLQSVGAYRGLIDDSKDSITWKLLMVDASFGKYTNFCGTSRLLVTGPINFNYDPTFKDTIFDNFTDDYLITNRTVYMGTPYNGGNLSGIGDCSYRISDDNSVEFKYKNNGVYHTFKGIKIK